MDKKMNAEWERSWLVKSYPHTITKEQHDEIIKLLDEHDPNANIYYVRYGDTIKIITPHGPLKASFLPTFSAESNQVPTMHYGDQDSDAQEKYQEFLDEWDLDDDPPSFEEWYKGDEYHEAEGKKRSGLLSDPFDELSLDSGDWKGIVAGFGVGLLALFGYTKLRK
jgi:hypothetical protein